MQLTIIMQSSESPLLKWVFKVLYWGLAFVSSNSSTSLQNFSDKSQKKRFHEKQTLHILYKVTITFLYTSDQHFPEAFELKPVQNEIRQSNRHHRVFYLSILDGKQRKLKNKTTGELQNLDQEKEY